MLWQISTLEVSECATALARTVYPLALRVSNSSMAESTLGADP